MSLLDKLKQKADDLELRTKAEQLQEAAAKAAQQAKEKAGDLAADHRDRVEGALDTATAKIDEKTDGKYADHLARAREQVVKGVDRIAERGAAAGAAGAGAAGTAGAASAATGAPGPFAPSDSTEPDAAAEPEPDVARESDVTPEPVVAPGAADGPGGGFDAAAGDLPAPEPDSLADAAPLPDEPDHAGPHGGRIDSDR